jgi:hypothetical protein
MRLVPYGAKRARANGLARPRGSPSLSIAIAGPTRTEDASLGHKTDCEAINVSATAGGRAICSREWLTAPPYALLPRNGTVLGDLQCKLQHMNGRGGRGPSRLRFRSTMIFFLLYRARPAKSAHGVAPLNLHPPKNRATTSPCMCAQPDLAGFARLLWSRSGVSCFLTRGAGGGMPGWASHRR